MENEIPKPEIPPGHDLPPENPSPEIPPVENPPPEIIPPVTSQPTTAAELVISGEVKSEREIQLEKKLLDAEKGRRDAEFFAAEKERKAQELFEIQSRPPGVKREKRAAHWTNEFLGGETE